VACLVLFDSMSTCLVYFILTAIALISLKLLFPIVPTYYPYEPINFYLGIFNIFLTITLLYLAVRMFKYENMKYAKEIIETREIIEEKQKETMDSIRYAQHIQQAFITSEKYFEKHLRRLKDKSKG
jgi:cadmium resistance protein CadD (predicted permease)